MMKHEESWSKTPIVFNASEVEQRTSTSISAVEVMLLVYLFCYVVTMDFVTIHGEPCLSHRSTDN